VSQPHASGAQTDLDREVEHTRRLGEDQKHVFGERGRGAPDFNKALDPAAARPPAASAPKPAPPSTPSPVPASPPPVVAPPSHP
jgi:hypothetical protein